MFGHEYYHQILRRYVVVFGTLFNEIVLTKREANGTLVKRIKVPISYGPKERFLARLDADPDLNRPVAISLPRMGFEITGMSYAPERKLKTIQRFVGRDVTDPNRYKSAYAPVPYDITFELNIVVRSVEDGTQIVEQILPFFTPEWTNTVRIIDDPEIFHDVPVVLTSVTTQDTYDADFSTRRAVIWTLTFVMKGYFYGPVSNKKVIKFANTNIYSSTTANTASASVFLRPGLTANGEPTTDINATVPASEIEVTDNWDFITIIEDPLNG